MGKRMIFTNRLLERVLENFHQVLWHDSSARDVVIPTWYLLISCKSFKREIERWYVMKFASSPALTWLCRNMGMTQHSWALNLFAQNPICGQLMKSSLARSSVTSSNGRGQGKKTEGSIDFRNKSCFGKRPFNLISGLLGHASWLLSHSRDSARRAVIINAF